jgi:hypothetical protein
MHAFHAHPPDLRDRLFRLPVPPKRRHHLSPSLADERRFEVHIPIQDLGPVEVGGQHAWGRVPAHPVELQPHLPQPAVTWTAIATGSLSITPSR